MRDLTSWDLKYLGLARYVSNWSKDPSTKVGAIVTDSRNRQVSLGFNGLPIGVLDSEERLNNRELKYKMIVHAERNALLFARGSVEGCRLYTWPFMPCSVCAGMVIQSGIKEVVSIRSTNPRWMVDFGLSTMLFYESGVKLILLNSTDEIK